MDGPTARRRFKEVVRSGKPRRSFVAEGAFERIFGEREKGRGAVNVCPGMLTAYGGVTHRKNAKALVKAGRARQNARN